MSTSYYVYCHTCDEELTGRNDCDNRPHIPQYIIDNYIFFCHLGMMKKEIPPSDNYVWVSINVEINHERIDPSHFNKHINHKLTVRDEYGKDWIKP